MSAIDIILFLLSDAVMFILTAGAFLVLAVYVKDTKDYSALGFSVTLGLLSCFYILLTIFPQWFDSESRRAAIRPALAALIIQIVMFFTRLRFSKALRKIGDKWRALATSLRV